MRPSVVAMAAALAGALAATAAFPARAAEAYPSKVTIYIGFGAGGSYDYYARLVARHLGNRLPGKPQVIPSNMPGAGGMKATNYLYEVAAKDGSALGIAPEGAPLEQILGTKGIKFDAARFNWVGRATTTTNSWFTLRASGIASFRDLRKRQATIASSGRGITAYTPNALNALAGTRLKVIAGYRGSTDAVLALERGEVDIAYGAWSWVRETKADWLREKKLVPLFLAADARPPELPEVPLTSVVGNTPDESRILGFLASTATVGRSILAPPGVPGDRVAALRQAFMAMVKNAEFLADAKRAKAELAPLSGADLQKIVEDVVNAPKPLIEKLRAAVGASS